MAFVIDASVAISMLLADERSEYAEIVLALAAEETAHVPLLWHSETRNALLMASRRGRIKPEDLSEFVRVLKELPVVTHSEQNQDLILSLAVDQGLTVYDATYLALAQTIDGALATLDRALARAAEQVGVPVVAGPAAPPAPTTRG
ncbi:MAG: type II toxin-antitoxin system VapC family toxin [Proteobacteria bacterium]|nr:type II toxin-antitoxin system VapC family toxin [Pseudomonadota bacterium]